MEKNRSQASAGGSQGLSIIIEGPSKKLVDVISAGLVKRLETSGRSTLADDAFKNKEESVLSATLRLFDKAGMPLSASTLSLLVAITLHVRLKKTQAAKADNKYCLSNSSWLSEAFHYEEIGHSDISKQIIADCGFMRPEVWVVIDEPHGVYARVAKQAGVRVYSPKIPKNKLLDTILEHIDYAEKAQIVEKQEEIRAKIESYVPLKSEPKTPEKAKETPSLPEEKTLEKPTVGKEEIKDPREVEWVLSELAVSSLAMTSDPASFTEARFHYEDGAEGKEYRYYRPKNVGDKVLRAYEMILNKIFDNYSHVVKTLGGDEKARRIAGSMLPLSTLKAVYVKPETSKDQQKSGFYELTTKAVHQSVTHKKMHDIILNSLPLSLDANPAPGVTLEHYLPRNEMELASHILYEESNIDLASLADSVSTLPHETKQAIFTAFIEDSSEKQALRNVTYTWDLVADYKAFRRFVRIMPPGSVTKQAFTPRYGYDMPKPIEVAALGDTYEQAFDLSLELYSLLQAAGFEPEAQYAVLTGHRLRFKVTLSAHEFMSVLSNKTQRSFDVERLIKEMHLQVLGVHPLIAGIIKSEAATD